MAPNVLGGGTTRRETPETPRNPGVKPVLFATALSASVLAASPTVANAETPTFRLEEAKRVCQADVQNGLWNLRAQIQKKRDEGAVAIADRLQASYESQFSQRFDNCVKDKELDARIANADAESAQARAESAQARARIANADARIANAEDITAYFSELGNQFKLVRSQSDEMVAILRDFRAGTVSKSVLSERIARLNATIARTETLLARFDEYRSRLDDPKQVASIDAFRAELRRLKANLPQA